MKRTIVLILMSLIASTQSHAWTINANFETGTVGQRANGDDAFRNQAFSSTIYSNTYVHSGSKSAKSSITKGTDGWGEWGGLINYPSGVGQGGQIWYRVWAYYPSGFDFTCSCTEGIKFMRIGSNAGSWDYYLATNGVDIATGVTSKFYENHPYPFTDIRGLGGPISLGSWHAFELYVKLSPTAGQGIIRAWRDGKLIFEDKETPTMANASDIFKESLVWTYWNGKAPKSQSAYVDDIIITNETPNNLDAFGNHFIGTGSSSAGSSSVGTTLAPPMPPTPQ